MKFLNLELNQKHFIPKSKHGAKTDLLKYILQILYITLQQLSENNLSQTLGKRGREADISEWGLRRFEIIYKEY